MHPPHPPTLGVEVAWFHIFTKGNLFPFLHDPCRNVCITLSHCPPRWDRLIQSHISPSNLSQTLSESISFRTIPHHILLFYALPFDNAIESCSPETNVFGPPHPSDAYSMYHLLSLVLHPSMIFLSKYLPKMSFKHCNYSISASTSPLAICSR